MPLYFHLYFLTAAVLFSHMMLSILTKTLFLRSLQKSMVQLILLPIKKKKHFPAGSSGIIISQLNAV